MHTIYYSFFHVRYIYLSLFRLPCCFLFLAILYTFPYPTNPLPIQWRYTVPCTLFIYNLLITLYPCVTFHRKDSSMCMYVCVYNRVNMSQRTIQWSGDECDTIHSFWVNAPAIRPQNKKWCRAHTKNWLPGIRNIICLLVQYVSYAHYALGMLGTTNALQHALKRVETLEHCI